MSNADTMRQFYDRVNAGDIDGFSALIADDMIEHEKIEGLPQTKEGVVQFFEMFRAAFSDLRMEAEDIIESGDKAWARIRITGTNDGEFMGMPATGKSVDLQAVDIVRFNDEGSGRGALGRHRLDDDDATARSRAGAAAGLDRQRSWIRDGRLAGEALADVDGRPAVHEPLALEQRHVLGWAEGDDGVRVVAGERGLRHRVVPASRRSAISRGGEKWRSSAQSAQPNAAGARGRRSRTRRRTETACRSSSSSP